MDNKLLENAYKSNDRLLAKLSLLYSDMFKICGDIGIIESKLRAYFQPQQEEQAELYNEILDHLNELLEEMVEALKND